MCLPGHSFIRHWRRTVVALAVLLVTACGQPDTPPPTALLPSDEIRDFTGNWTATGNRQVLELEPGTQAGSFQLSGALMLSGKQRIGLAFMAQVIGFSDPASGLVGRSVWTDDHGDKVFSALRGEPVGPGKLIKGTFTGGTGRYAGLSGEYHFQWQRIGSIHGSEFTGRVVGMKGWALLNPPPATSPTASGDRP